MLDQAAEIDNLSTIQTHTHTLTHTQTHTHTNTYTHTHTHTRTLKWSPSKKKLSPSLLFASYNHKRRFYDLFIGLFKTSSFSTFEHSHTLSLSLTHTHTHVFSFFLSLSNTHAHSLPNTHLHIHSPTNVDYPPSFSHV